MIFAIKPFEIHDGDGIRTTVFFKGCPLSCKWCHNPESLSFRKEIFYETDRCAHCLKCTSVCSANTVFDGKHVFLRESCNLCGDCESVCPNNVFEIQGRDMSVREIVDKVLEDRIFLVGSGGGVTLSGGECLAQPDMAIELLQAFKAEGINTAVDTCGYVPREVIERVIPYTDTFLYDIKAIDEDVHVRCTGRSNRLILDNLLYIDSQGVPIEIRIPFVPGYNDGEIDKIADFVRGLRHVRAVKILPYHDYADTKYKALGMEDTLPEVLPCDEEIALCESKFDFLKSR